MKSILALARHVITFGLVLSLLQACAPAAVVGAGAAGTASHDRRSTGAFVDDAAIELRGQAFATADEELKKNVHINVTSMNGVVLLTGEAASVALRDRVLGEIRLIEDVRRVVNEIKIEPPSSVGQRTNDTWITTKVKTKLLGTRGVDASRIKVVTEQGSVYLLGLVTQAEGDAATEATRRINGVERVVKLFEFVP